MNFKAILSFVTALVSLTSFGQYTVKVALTTDNYPGEITWTLDQGGTELLSGGPYAGNLTDFEDQIDLAEGDYSFTISDSYGDGICCGQGQGGYVLSETTSMQVISAGGEYGSGETIDFSLPFVPPVLGCTDPEALNYNPEAESDDGTCEYLVSQLAIDLVEVADGFQSIVDLTNAGDDRLFVVEQNGRIKILNADFTTQSENFLDISSLTDGGGEQGLLGLAFHPDYADNGYFYVNYTNNSGSSVIARYTVSSADPNIADPGSAEIILQQSQPYSNHNAGDINFGPDGYLYIPMGDGGSGGDPENRAQNPSTLLGKMLRIDVDGGSPYAIPADNPFVGNADYLPEIWAVGLRNTWRFSFDAETGDMWMGDVGQNVWEEIDFEPAGSAGGLNYGWRCTEGLVDYDQSQCSSSLVIEYPISVYNHSGGACSITGGYVYRGSEFPDMQGKYFYTDYCNGQFGWVAQTPGGDWEEETFLGPQGFGWSTFGEDANSELYVCNLNGTVYRLEDVCSGLTASITADGNVLTASEGASYVWLNNGEVIPGATDQTYTVTENGAYSVVIGDGTGCTAQSEFFVITGVADISSEVFTMSPNPANDQLNVVLDQNQRVESIQIYSIAGKLIVSENRTNGNTLAIDVSNLTEGIYVLDMITDKSRIRTNFVVAR